MPDYGKIYREATERAQQAAAREQAYRRADLLTPAQAAAPSRQEGHAESNHIRTGGKR